MLNTAATEGDKISRVWRRLKVGGERGGID
jgi:hypothetical protein